MGKIKISEAEYNLSTGKGKIAVFIYNGLSNPKIILKEAVKEYVQTNEYFEFIESSLDNPWMVVVLSGINQMEQRDFNPEEDRLSSVNQYHIQT